MVPRTPLRPINSNGTYGSELSPNLRDKIHILLSPIPSNKMLFEQKEKPFLVSAAPLSYRIVTNDSFYVLLRVIPLFFTPKSANKAV
ncbi:hypothetical protein N7501_008139 [Penicillium viridicatum]|nr:hypothetical protein N7501_008139 [Penicillium viridicatum]